MKRGSSGLSLLVGVDKAAGMSSHDVVNRVRRIFGERRVGHTGTLDPLATGVLPICIGPATRLDKYLTGHGKSYRATMRFGFETTTDDAQGQPTEMGSVPAGFEASDFAEECVRGLVGYHDQTPPQYSAVKVNGRKAYEVARAGGSIDLPARRIHVDDARFVSVGKDPVTDLTTWTFDVDVSKGTYIRTLVRDLGRALDCPAHLLDLRRLASGSIGIGDCVSVETLEGIGAQAAIDPVIALGLRYAFADDCGRFVAAGNKLHGHQLALREAMNAGDGAGLCPCTARSRESGAAPADGELVSIVVANRLSALYRYDAAECAYKPDCVFSVPVARN